MGRRIRSDARFIGSPINELENMILDLNATISRTVGPSAVRVDGSNLNTAFIALAAPSLEGKTQSVFTFHVVRPLYFALKQTSNRAGAQISQTIYLNFASLNTCIENFAEKDLALIRRMYPTNDALRDSFAKYSEITSEALKTKHCDTKFLVLGLFAHLIKEANEYYAVEIAERARPRRLNWMEFYARRRENTFISAISMNEIERKYGASFFRKYCLFLDEFVGDDWAVYIRNLSRTIGLISIVSNTNTEIANITGKLQSSISRGEADKVWSILFTRLNSVSWSVLENYYHLEPKLELIIGRLDNPRTKIILRQFFLNFKTNQIKYLRPGIAILFANSIVNFSTVTGQLTLNKFLDDLFKSIADKIYQRKRRIRTYNGTLATVGLLTSNAFYKRRLTKKDRFHNKRFLRDHLFHLINPDNEKKFLCLTYPPVEEDDVNLTVFRASGELVEWTREYTYFRDKEIITLLACYFIPLSRPIASILEQARYSSSSRPDSLIDSSNTEALSLKGNFLEVIATAAIIDASHHGFRHISTASISGQDGKTFIKNLIVNLIKDKHFRKNDRINFPVTIGFDAQLNGLLKNILIPFLFSCNWPVPKILRKLSTSDEISIEPYYRTANKTEIDAKFDIFMKLRSEDNFLSRVLAGIECKNWASKLKSDEMQSIIAKALANFCRLNIIFCNKIINFTRTGSLLSEFCRTNNVNIYRLHQMAPQKSFDLVPFNDNNRDDATLICIILESDIINM